jgi:hypothetical protein
MHVRYTVTLDDFVAFNLYITRKSGAGRPGYLIMWLVPPALGIAATVRLLQLDHLPLAIGLTGISLFWLVFLPVRFRDALARNARAFVKKLGGRGIIGERGLILTEEMLVAVSEIARTEVRWENMAGVDVVGETTYIFISGISALIVPRRGFDSDAEYEAVRDFALRKLAGRKASDPREEPR